MFSGIWPPGSSRAPGRGKTGITTGQSCGPRYAAFVRIPYSRAVAASGKQDRGEPPPPRDRHLVRRAPGLEKLDELLASAVLVPTAIPTHDFKEVIDRFRTLPTGIEGDREVEPRLVIERVGFDPLLQIAEIAERSGLLGEVDRGAGAGERRIVRLGGRRH